MNRILIIWCSILILVIGLIFYADSQKPRPVNWLPTYGLEHKNPLGLYVFRQEAQNIFKGDTIREINVTPYEYFEPKYSYKDSTYTIQGTFIHVNEEVQLDGESAQELLYFAQHGNTVFISAKYFPDVLLDSLGVSMPQTFSIRDTVVAKAGASKEFRFAEGSSISYFNEPGKNATVLGRQHVIGNNKEEANLISVPYGYGKFLLHTQPAAFSNFYLLKDNYSSYAESILSYIPDGNIYWYASPDEKRISGSPLRYIMSQPALKAAYWISLLGLLVFILFNAKRRQRIVPEIPKVRNTTVDFTKTIGNLYYNSGDHHNTIDRMLVYFFEKVRNELKIDTSMPDEAFIEKLSQKTGRPKEQVHQLVTAINRHRARTQSTENDVIEMNKAIENIML